MNKKTIWVPALTCGFVHANSDFSTWITNLYCSLPWSEIFACKPATFGAELQVCMGPRHHLSFCASNTAWLAPEWLVSMGPNPYLWFLFAKQRLLEKNYKYLCIPALICGFCIHNSAFWTRISNLYGSQTSSVVLWMQNSVISIRRTSLYGSQPSCVVFGCKAATFGAE